jgi:ADP-ribose pyrophosphatase YjhB (NUDIX family)
MKNVIQSAWWIVYYIAKDWEPRYLLIKRLALSKKIERVAPKWKVQSWETTEKAAIREVWEETGIPINQIRIRQKLWTTHLRNTANIKGQMNKDVTYYLMHFIWDPEIVDIVDAEWYVGIYKRATLQEVIGLIYYNDIRELIRESYVFIKQTQKNDDVKKEFIKKLDI